MHLPNKITLGRIVLAAVLFVLLDTVCREQPGGLVWYVAFALFVVTVLTDGLDGYLARSRDQISAFGRIADPFADKIVICGVLVLATTLEQTREMVPPWIVLVVLAREFLVSGLRGYLEGQGTRFGARWEGKTKLFIQAIFCGAVLFYPGDRMAWVAFLGEICLWATLVITVYSGLSYLRAARDILVGGADL